MRIVRRALSIGLTVKELAGIFRERDRGGAPCLRVRKLAGEKLIELEATLRELQSSRRDLLAAIAEWDRILAETPLGRPARLLESFAANHSKKRSGSFGLEGLFRRKQKRENQR
jgi:DNA-binding transcriptional MerR regulator